jgi:DNA-binding transcriptional ArsR family regulator
MHAFDVLGDPVRRRILELLARGELSAGSITDVIQKEFGITQAGVSQHLRALRESGFVRVRVDGPRRIYSVDSDPLQEVEDSGNNA